MTIIGGVLVGIGVALILLAAIGTLRFPDVLTRSSAATKAAGLGVACVLGGAAFLFGTLEAAVKLSLAVVLQFATAPVGGHVIGRAAYRSGAPLWEGTWIDELAPFARGERPPAAGSSDAPAAAPSDARAAAPSDARSDAPTDPAAGERDHDAPEAG